MRSRFSLCILRMYRDTWTASSSSMMDALGGLTRISTLILCETGPLSVNRNTF